MAGENTDDNIPTLTDIIQLGDESMKNHFDASVFDAEEETEEITETDMPVTDELKDTINELVAEAVKETLPTIEAEFKQKLSEQIIEKLSKN